MSFNLGNENCNEHLQWRTQWKLIFSQVNNVDKLSLINGSNSSKLIDLTTMTFYLKEVSPPCDYDQVFLFRFPHSSTQYNGVPKNPRNFFLTFCFSSFWFCLIIEQGFKL